MTSSDPHLLLSDLAERLYAGDAKGVAELAQRALDAKLDAQAILQGALLPGMERVGRDFKAGELFIPEIIVAARAMHAGVDVLRPHLVASDLQGQGKVVLGTVKGDLHDIGKKLVGIMLQGAGFTVVDLGHDVAPERFVQAVRDEQPLLLGLSALLSTTMPMMKATMDALVGAGLAGAVKVMVGGAPVTQAWADEIGAQGYAPDAVSAVERARQLVSVQRG
jgi:5-methyltetrahydrofolate--homocysteine methyltransferase